MMVASLAGGLLGSLTGLGGGVILIPVLVLLFGVDIRYAVGASLVAVVATSCGAASAFVREGYTNIRLAIFLEVATATGAVLGALLAQHVPKNAVGLIFGLVLLWTAWSSIARLFFKPRAATTPPATGIGSGRLMLGSTYPTPGGGEASYEVTRPGAGFAIMFGAGILSALVGIGSGIVKVLAMDRVMRVPFKVSTTTSNFMIGVTAAASSGVYLHRGQIEPTLAAPVALGALGGSLLGARLLPKVRTDHLRVLFALVVLGAGVQMIARAMRGTL